MGKIVFAFDEGNVDSNLCFERGLSNPDLETVQLSKFPWVYYLCSDFNVSNTKSYNKRLDLHVERLPASDCAGMSEPWIYEMPVHFYHLDNNSFTDAQSVWNKISHDVQDGIIYGNGTLLLAFCRENIGFRVYDAVYEYIERIGVPKDKVAFTYCGSMQYDENEKYCKETGKDPITVFPCNMFENTLRYFSSDYDLSFDIGRERKALCFNHMARIHRVFVAAHLQDQHYDDVYLSFRDGDYLNGAISDKYWDIFSPEVKNRLCSKVNKFLKSIPFNNTGENECNTHYRDRHKINTKFSTHLYEQSYFSVVNETYCYKNDRLYSLGFRFQDDEWVNDAMHPLDVNSPFLTEKSFKPLAFGHPFISVATSHNLDELKRYGYKTFGNVFNESYDLIEDDNSRMIAIINELDVLCSLSRHDLDDLFLESIPAIKYNKQHLHRDYASDLDKQLINFIEGLYERV